MNPNVEILIEILDDLRKEPESARPRLEAKASIHSAIAVTESLLGLTVAVNDLANRTIGRLNELTRAIDAATAQARQSSDESSNLSKKLNTLTVWIALAAIASAAGTIAQAMIALSSHPK